MNIRHDQARPRYLKQMNPALASTSFGPGLVPSLAPGNPLRAGFRLNEWQVFPNEGSIDGPQGATHLEPKVMEVLVLLAGHAGQLVEREFLIREIWGERTVSDEPLTRCIAVLRRALGDSPKRPRCIQTVPKRGYRLVADVASGCAARASEDIHSAASRKIVVVIAWPLLAALAFLAVDRYLSSGDALPDGSIAVLPFESLSSDPENVFIADGIQDELLNQLAKNDSLTVVSRTSVLEYRGRPKNMRDIGQELGVVTIVEGGVRRSGDTIRVNVDLIDAQTDRHIWVESYDRQLTTENVLAIQSEMATSIANALQVELSH